MDSSDAALQGARYRLPESGALVPSMFQMKFFCFCFCFKKEVSNQVNCDVEEKLRVPHGCIQDELNNLSSFSFG